MGTVVEKKILDLMSDHGTSIYYYWNCEKGEWWVKTGNFKGLSLESDKYNPIENILMTNQLDKDAYFVLNRYYMRMLGGTVRPIADDYMRVTFRVHRAGMSDRIYTFTSYFKKNEKGIITEISGKGREYTDAEIMDNDILSGYTIDFNPAIFHRRIEKLVRKNPEEKYAVIEFDICNFKGINDKYGTATGDKILSYISNMLSILCGNNYIYARMNADVFLLVMNYHEIDEIMDFIGILDFNLSWYEGIEYTFSYGVNLFPESIDDLDIRTLVDGASIARKSIKGNEIDNIAFYDTELKDAIEYQKNMGARLRVALENNEFLMYLQPKYNIESNTVVGSEALLRWYDPECGIVMPEKFIYILEANGLILSVDRFVWEQACITLRKWIDEKKEVKPISVNVSRKYIDNGSIVEYLKMLINKYKIPIDLLEIEITETAESEGTEELIISLKENGFTVLMDDFGSGYSSLTMLRSTPFDIVKLDKNFLSEFMDNEKGKTIVSHMVAMSKEMGISIVAEGVETREQADFLFSCGCTTAQGYLYAEPMPLEKFEELI